MLEAFKTHITPAQSMLLFTKPKVPKKNWTEHFVYLVAVAEVSGGTAEYMVLNNIVQYASEDLRVVLMAKIDAHRTHYLQQAEQLAHFAQAWESGTKKLLPKAVSNVVRESRFRETRRCHECGEIGHLREMCQNRSKKVAKDQLNFTLAISDHGIGINDHWILDSGSSLHLCSDKSWLEDAQDAHGFCIHPNVQELNISKVGNFTLRVSAAGETKSVQLTEVYFAVGLAHTLISFGKLDAKG
uniref:Uncharacterized protein AlNc14C950G12661 n=1 Tax=Albugo laibachii Nc14 TaxID=890382 RepID=F0X2B5_9STRA|nr:conserved hypothetical protein [Albugo laibachii Nc14]|eukprot:CCA27997.1 conserved hypothetical protein [Albugo laibachii Nc14]